MLYEESVFPIECYERCYRGRFSKVIDFITILDGIK